jgi:adenine-specific DNA-methyltransferase
MNLLEQLTELLSTDERLVINGKLAKNKIVELALSLDSTLLKLLLSKPKIKSHFFTDVDGVLIFDKVAFQKFVNNKSFLPDSFTRFKNKTGLSVDDKYLDDSNDVVLAWPYKDCILEGGQTKEDQKRKEVFWNEALAPEQVDNLLAPKAFSNFKKYDINGGSDNFEFSKTESLLIRGNNLLALESIKRPYSKKVKLIYIDPPYYFHSQKKEDTFAYNSNFKLSTWLTFMRNRLLVAKELLADDGAIFVQVSDDGVAELHLLMKEVFNTEQNNFINKITLRTKSPSGFASVNPGVFETAEYIISFAKNKSKWSYNRQYIPCDYDENYNLYIENYNDNFSDWVVKDLKRHVLDINCYETEEIAIEQIGQLALTNLIGAFALENAEKVFQSTAISNKAGKKIVEARDITKNNNEIMKLERDDNYTVYVSKGREMAFYSKKVRDVDGKKTPTILLSNIWTDISYEGISAEGGVTLKKAKKPEKLLKRIIEMASNEGDIVLDYFLGSGTTCAVAHKLNRKFIGIEQLDYGKNDSFIRLKKVVDGDKTGISKEVNWQGGGSFVYCELAELASKYSDRIEQAKNSEELAAIWNDLKESSNLSYKVDPKSFDKNIQSFDELTLEDQKGFLIEVIDKNQLYVNYSEIDDEANGISELDKKYNKQFYGV